VGLTPTLLLLARLGGLSRLSEGEQFSTELVALPFGLFASALLFCQFLPQRGLGLFGDLQANTELRRSGRLLHQPVGKFADRVAGSLCGNIRAPLFFAETTRRLPLPLPRISKGLKAVYGDKPASPNALTLEFSFNVTLFDVPTDSAW
jgi:hypothetical protein